MHLLQAASSWPFFNTSSHDPEAVPCPRSPGSCFLFRCVASCRGLVFPRPHISLGRRTCLTPVWSWKRDAPAPVLAAGGAGSLKAEPCHNPPCTCCAFLRGVSLHAPPSSRACMRTCVLVHVHLTDLKQVCKTRLPPRLKGSRATQDLGGRGKATSVQKPNSASC